MMLAEITPGTWIDPNEIAAVQSMVPALSDYYWVLIVLKNGHRIELPSVQVHDRVAIDRATLAAAAVADLMARLDAIVHVHGTGGASE